MNKHLNVALALASILLPACSSAVKGAKTQSCPEPMAVSKAILANASWQGGGAVLSSGDKLDIVSSGTWCVGPGLCSDSNGRTDLRTVGRTGYAYVEGDGFEGQLIGRIGNGSPFVVGNAVSIHVPSDQSGQLQFVINDDLAKKFGKGLEDNTGTLSVTVTLTTAKKN